jgi:spermidine/putrescine transport system ATP-binding protein
MTPDLECIDLTKRFGEDTAVDGVSFSVAPGSFFSILGPSGCGKTTIMRMIAGFLEPTGGDILIKGASVLNVAPNRRPVNMVFQHLALFPMMNVADNIGYGLRRAGLTRSEINRKVEEVLARIGLPATGTRRIEELSGGQKQRVAIARCMVLEPDVLLLDEPLGALDLKLREHMKIELKALQADFDTTFVYITHDQSEALVMSDQIAVMNGGKFEQVGTARDLYYRPETPFVAGFVGDSNRWKGRVEQRNGAQLQIRTETGLLLSGTTSSDTLATGSTAEMFVRPEAIRLARNRNGLQGLANCIRGRITSLLFNAASSKVLVRGMDNDHELEVTLPQSGEFADLAKQDEVHVGWTGEQAICFNAGAP